MVLLMAEIRRSPVERKVVSPIIHRVLGTSQVVLLPKAPCEIQKLSILLLELEM